MGTDWPANRPVRSGSILRQQVVVDELTGDPRYIEQADASATAPGKDRKAFVLYRFFEIVQTCIVFGIPPFPQKNGKDGARYSRRCFNHRVGRVPGQIELDERAQFSSTIFNNLLNN